MKIQKSIKNRHFNISSSRNIYVCLSWSDKKKKMDERMKKKLKHKKKKSILFWQSFIFHRLATKFLLSPLLLAVVSGRGSRVGADAPRHICPECGRPRRESVLCRVVETFAQKWTHESHRRWRLFNSFIRFRQSGEALCTTCFVI